MLEQRIEELTVAVIALTAKLEGVNTSTSSASAPEAIVESAEAAGATQEKPKRTRKSSKSLFDTDASEPAQVAAAETAAVEETATEQASDEPNFDDFSGDIDVAEEIVDIDTLRTAIRDVITKGGKEKEAEYRSKVGKVLSAFNVKTLPELAESEYADVLVKLRSIQ